MSLNYTREEAVDFVYAEYLKNRPNYQSGGWKDTDQLHGPDYSSIGIAETSANDDITEGEEEDSEEKLLVEVLMSKGFTREQAVTHLKLSLNKHETDQEINNDAM